ncbi:MAG: hypothetical protein WC412_00495 [Candidatus Omnitrophota bacterium]|jgi:hypothetical protein
MRNKTKFLVALVLISLCVAPLFARNFSFGPARSFEKPPEPRLVCPINDVVALSGDTLLFKWWHADIGIDRYEFNLYKGSQMFSDGLMLHKILPFSQSSIKIDAGLFENGRVYTWSLRQVTDSGLKSDKSFITFSVLKE